MNPEAGFRSAYAPGTGEHTNANAMKTLWGNAVSPTSRSPTTATCGGRGMTGGAPGPPDRLEGQRLDAGLRRPPAAHPNARFTVPAAQCPIIAP
ncbi:phosphoenolpyruvate carboxykinase (GTP) [Streptomyces tricolor]|nr:phosphoenolpyruvate carboxykinase (GTP) [Streptomyces tricolor]